MKVTMHLTEDVVDRIVKKTIKQSGDQTSSLSLHFGKDILIMFVPEWIQNYSVEAPLYEALCAERLSFGDGGDEREKLELLNRLIRVFDEWYVEQGVKINADKPRN